MPQSPRTSGDPHAAQSRTARSRTSQACNACRRRKERCDACSPCSRCIFRKVAHECRRTSTGADQVPGGTDSLPLQETTADTMITRAETSSAGIGDSLLLRDQKGQYTFVGDSSNLSFLQTIRGLVRQLHGKCGFVDDQSHHVMIEASPDRHSYSLHNQSILSSPQLSIDTAKDLVKAYIIATNCVLDVFDESQLLEHLPAWIDDPEARAAIPGPLYYLVCAIGAQTSSDGSDVLAHKLFECGRHTAQRFMEDVSLWTVRAYSLITMYMLNACRRNAAFMYMGTALRAAYTLGLHRKEVASQFSKQEQHERERLWKVIRILDLFMGASLGRPPMTTESRVMSAANEDYSASTDLCFIFERILTEVYACRKISTSALSSIGDLHRSWAGGFRRGMITDRIDGGDYLLGTTIPNISAFHLIEAYYWTIILLTRPFLTEAVIAHIDSLRSGRVPNSAAELNSSQSGPVIACVHSAIKTIDLLKVLLSVENLPRRLPFITNSVFVAGLVLGLAYFGDLDQIFSLGTHLRLAHRLLLLFGDDVLAQRNAHTIEQMISACDDHVQARYAERMRRNDVTVAGIFGQVQLATNQGPSAVRERLGEESVLSDMEHMRTSDSSARSAGLTYDNNVESDNFRTRPNGQAIYDFDYIPTDLEFPRLDMSPRTLCFDNLFGNSPFFSTISSSL